MCSIYWSRVLWFCVWSGFFISFGKWQGLVAAVMEVDEVVTAGRELVAAGGAAFGGGMA